MPPSNLPPVFYARILLFAPSPPFEPMPVSTSMHSPRKKSRNNRFHPMVIRTALDPLTSVYRFPIRSCNTATGPLQLPARDRFWYSLLIFKLALNWPRPNPSPPRRYTVSAASGRFPNLREFSRSGLPYLRTLTRSLAPIPTNEIPPVHIPARLRHDLLPLPWTHPPAIVPKSVGG